MGGREPDAPADLLPTWLRRGGCRRCFVTLKTGEARGADALERLKREFPALTTECHLRRLGAKKQAICAYGTAVPAVRRNTAIQVAPRPAPALAAGHPPPLIPAAETGLTYCGRMR